MIRGYMAMSADGYVADRDGGVHWLEPFQEVDCGYTTFIAGIDRVVMGRVTYEQIRAFGTGWPYPGKPGIVVASRDITGLDADVETWRGDVQSLAEHLAGLGGDTWVVGGAKLQSAFIDAGALGRLELFVIPVLLGGGVPLFESGARPVPLRLAGTETFGKGIVRLDYRL